MDVANFREPEGLSRILKRTRVPPDLGRTQRKVEFPFYFYNYGKPVHIVAELSDRPGTLARVLAILGTRVDFVGTTSYSIGNDRAIFSAVANLLSESDTAESIQELMALPVGVNWSKVTEGRQGVLVDRFHYGLQTGSSEPLLMVPATALSAMFQEMVRKFDSGGEMILYNQGRAYSRARWAGIRPMLGPSPETRLDEVAAMVGAVGWAIVQTEYEPGSNSIEFRNSECFECSSRKDHALGCPFLRGMAAGLVEALFRTEVTSEETECKRRGDEACVFVVRSKEGIPLVRSSPR